jgi:predicted amidohydrolase
MRLASFQRFPIFDAPASAGSALLRDLRWADERGVDLALFPECSLQGHAYDRATIERRAVPLDDPALQDLLNQLAGVHATTILGLFERRGSRIFNSAIVVEKGTIAGVYAKAHPNEEGVTPGSDFPLFRRSGFSFGINICFDGNFPGPAQQVAAQGAKLICYPLNNLLRPEKADIWRDKTLTLLQERARETGCWVASADVTGCYENALSYGCTVVVAPDGKVMVRAPELSEGAALFDLPPGPPVSPASQHPPERAAAAGP